MNASCVDAGEGLRLLLLLHAALTTQPVFITTVSLIFYKKVCVIATKMWTSVFFLYTLEWVFRLFAKWNQLMQSALT